MGTFQRCLRIGFGTLNDKEKIQVYSGDMFGESRATGFEHALVDLKLIAPTVPSKVIALWNNFMALAAKLDLPTPLASLYFLKSPTHT